LIVAISQSDDFLAFVHEELCYYQFEWKHDMSDAAVRRGSSSMRTLMWENKLQNAWKAVGFSAQPRVMSPTLAKYLESFDPKRLSFAQAGGALSHSVSMQGSVVLSPVRGIQEMQEIGRLGPPGQQLMKWTEFRDCVCLVVKGLTITRAEVVWYVANKLGGAHWDDRRDDSKELESKCLSMDRLRAQIQVASRDPVLYELMSTIHWMQQSDDIRKLREAIQIRLRL
jgi:hypothetical protein